MFYRILGPIHTLRPTSFALKTHQMFSVVTTSEEFKKAAITHHFGFVFENNTKWQHTVPVRTYSINYSEIKDCSWSDVARDLEKLPRYRLFFQS